VTDVYNSPRCKATGHTVEVKILTFQQSMQIETDGKMEYNVKGPL